ncbi:flavodoxin family protein [Aeromicrobium sp. 636]|uniref:FMN dependent NADH:quinone oxidoreductase n=1 Tax=Aeromicrobium senzhongii TaxID=2663859 RepID=A0A8I0ESZ2_9ACTN|nr:MULTISPECIES: NAD(P)H-dependent oxidoreductase [Aeromicrobium]MBC9225615.1 NAD(P)H-dependent oxidoreductase [Aeromicrobium senzhongii]MCQ3997724.1 flavodoxin family protein [Aeromicrobium sp. 636]MTB87651.1 flavodoxin family protein [Aeromicrobium senzhongii]QNL95314.1 NAD(P)H-dependent oxidoreductase [Aeromicrobium senzhongii]
MTLLRVDASIQGEMSASSALADLVVDEFVASHPGVPVVRRHLGQHPLPADVWATAHAAGFTPEDERSEHQREALAIAEEVAGELREAQAVVLALPLYNFGISQHAKTWIDVALAGGPQGTRLLEGKPTVLVTTRGGAYGPGTPREGWDHNTDFLRRILVDIWGADLTVIEREFTLVGVNPALDEFTETATQMRKTAEEAAVEAGAALAARRAA